MTLEEVERETHGVRRQHKEPFPDKRRAVVCSVYTFGYYCKLQCTTGNSNRNVRGIFPSSSCSVMSQPAVRLDHILVTLGLIFHYHQNSVNIKGGKVQQQLSPKQMRLAPPLPSLL